MTRSLPVGSLCLNRDLNVYALFLCITRLARNPRALSEYNDIPSSLMLKTPDTVLLVLRCFILFSIGLEESPSEVAESTCSRSSPSDLILMGSVAVVVIQSFVSCSMVGVNERGFVMI